jgi:superfamily I DNA/RNA helicase
VPIDLDSLNPPQREAVCHGHGPALVLAGAGSGKTRIITFRIAWLIEQGVPPDRILGVTFTNKAAREMQERLRGLIGHHRARRVRLSTFHALGAELLRDDIDRLGWRKPFSIADDADQYRVLREVLRELNLAGTSAGEPELLALFSRAKNAMTTPAGLPEARFQPQVARAERVFERYNQALRNLGAVDFDDLLLLPTLLLRDHEDVRKRLHERWRWLLVDEYQDTNSLQLALLRQLVEPTERNLMVVGDDDQSIYAFRGAVAGSILSFDVHFPGARVITLDQNYRSRGTILQAANAVIARNPNRRPKNLWSTLGQGRPLELVRFETDAAEADWIAARIAREVHAGSRRWHDYALLYRVNPQARVLEEALRQHRVPYRLVGGQSLFDRKEARDLSAYIRLLVHPLDELALRRIVNWPARGIGVQTLAQLDADARSRGTPLWRQMEQKAQAAAAPQTALSLDGEAPVAAGGAGRPRQGLSSLVTLLRTWQQKARSVPPDAPLGPFIEGYVEAIGLLAAIRSQESNGNVARVRCTILEELVQGATRARGETFGERLQAWSEQLSLDPAGSRNEDDDEAQGRVTLMTLHTCKGLEFPVVFMVGMYEGGLPHVRALQEPRGIEEERRLCYVGMTRAREHLILTRPRTVVKRNERILLKPSPFLAEIPRELMQRFAWHGPDAPPPPPGSADEAQRIDFEALRRLLDEDVPSGSRR